MAITPPSRLSEGPLPPDTVIEACAAIYRSWRRYLPHREAIEQAAQFAARCENLSGCGAAL